MTLHWHCTVPTSIMTLFFRYLTYKAIKNQFFMLDFCYFLNVSVLLQSLICTPTSDSGFCGTWFKSNFMMSHGPIALAILAWQSSLVFHSLDKMTSFYIHIMPVSASLLVKMTSDTLLCSSLSLVISRGGTSSRVLFLPRDSLLASLKHSLFPCSSTPSGRSVRITRDLESQPTACRCSISSYNTPSLITTQSW